MMRLYTIYDRPDDYPDSFVVRAFRVHDGIIEPGEVFCLAPTLEAARASLPPCLMCVERSLPDEPSIVETWF